MTDDPPVAVSHNLATAPTSARLRVEEIMFEYVRAYCRDVGIRRGAVLGPVQRGEKEVRVQIRDDEEVAVPLEYAYFVRVTPEDRVDSREERNAVDPEREPAPTSVSSDTI